MSEEGRGRISRSGLTQDIKMGSCVFQCDVPHQGIAQRQVGLFLYTVTGWDAMSCVCCMVFLCGSTLVKVPLLQSGTVVVWPKIMFKSDVKPERANKQTNKQTNREARYRAPPVGQPEHNNVSFHLPLVMSYHISERFTILPLDKTSDDYIFIDFFT